MADKGEYIASESTFYRVLREVNQLNRRDRAASPKTVTPPTGYTAIAPNQVWSWNITFLLSLVKGQFYWLYLIEDIFN